MTHQTLNRQESYRRPFIFILLVLAISLPIWFIGPIIERLLGTKGPANLPVSAIMVIAPVTAATILTWVEHRWGGVRDLWKRVVTFRQVRNKAWYVVILLIMPMMLCIDLAGRKWFGLPIPEYQVSLLQVVTLLSLFLIAATLEETGWMGYAYGPMEKKWGTLSAGLVLGLVWAVWHLIPFLQMGHSMNWILWQCLHLIMLRVLIVWLFKNTEESVPAAIVVHALYNLAVLPLGDAYDPFYFFVVSTLMAGLVVWLWGSKTLTGFRISRTSLAP